ncbi:MAG: HAMP domain-containing protein [Symploca sp. SIO2E9]|nr:HAMP domain-containing protein [Symploca sp. SIO2E9]
MTQTPPQNTSQSKLNGRLLSPANYLVGSQSLATNDPPPAKAVLSTSIEEKKLIETIHTIPSHSPLRRWLPAMSLRFKAMLLAIAVGTLPVLAIGGIAYQVANNSIKEQISKVQLTFTKSLAEQFSQFLWERYKEAEVLSSHEIFTQPQFWETTTIEQKRAILDRFQSTLGFYDSVVFLDLKGNVLFQSQSTNPLKGNYSDRSYYKQAIQTQQIAINNFQPSKSSGKFSIEFAAPVKQNGKLIGIVRTRIPIQDAEDIFKNLEDGNSSWHLINAQGRILATNNDKHKNQQLEGMLPQLPKLQEKEQSYSGVHPNLLEEETKSLVTYVPVNRTGGLPRVDAGALVSIEANVAFAPQAQLLRVILLGTGATALLLGAIAAIVAYKTTNPITTAASAVAKIGRGELDTRLKVQGEDEIAELADNINSMAEQLEELLQKQQLESERSKLLKDITLELFKSLDTDNIFTKAVIKIRECLFTDRVIVYKFNENWQGTIIAESVEEGYPHALGAFIDDPCFANNYVEKYKQGRVQATPDIYQAGLTSCHLKQLEPFAVKANLVAPILVAGELIGLLIAHQCSGSRVWQHSEVDLFSQLALQVGIALERAQIEQEKISAQQQSLVSDQLQKRILELLKEVDPIRKGDLTIRVRVTEDEIGTVADSYNATVGNLRKIVTQVQAAAQQVTATTISNQFSVQALSVEAQEQAQKIALALKGAKEMADSVAVVANKAKQAEAAVQQAAETVLEGDSTMNRTVDGMLAIQETVTQARQKVQRLGESSEKISRVVNLISSFAAQTNLLAFNASLEAARAGEEGRGFAIVADQVRTLAQQSAVATNDIEQLVTEIQAETKEVVAAMAVGNEQVLTGTQLVNESRQSLNKITSTSSEINQLVEAIAKVTVVQSQASDTVTKTMNEVAVIASKTSKEATLVSSSFGQLQTVAQAMQENVGQFKVK